MIVAEACTTGSGVDDVSGYSVAFILSAGVETVIAEATFVIKKLIIANVPNMPKMMSNKNVR